jgi:hypothetical protein
MKNRVETENRETSSLTNGMFHNDHENELSSHSVYLKDNHYDVYPHIGNQSYAGHGIPMTIEDNN